jgi:glutathione peroxidase
MTDTSLTDIALITLDGSPTTLAELADGAALVVNVASKCGLTPQYTALEQLAKDYRDRGLTVIGVPCNQFMGQEPTFPLLAKTDVNGPDRHPLYAALTKAADDSGEAGDIQWNFEKFLLAPGGKVAKRIRPRTAPDAPEVIAAIEQVLPR